MFGSERTPLTRIPFARSWERRTSPLGSSPTRPTMETFAPRFRMEEAKFPAAPAVWDLASMRMTGMGPSFEISYISPSMYSSRKRSPTTRTRRFLNSRIDETISRGDMRGLKLLFFLAAGPSGLWLSPGILVLPGSDSPLAHLLQAQEHRRPVNRVGIPREAWIPWAE